MTYNRKPRTNFYRAKMGAVIAALGLLFIWVKRWWETGEVWPF